jgi:hypothetical protein
MMARGSPCAAILLDAVDKRAALSLTLHSMPSVKMNPVKVTILKIKA